MRQQLARYVRKTLPPSKSERMHPLVTRLSIAHRFFREAPGDGAFCVSGCQSGFPYSEGRSTHVASPSCYASGVDPGKAATGSSGRTDVDAAACSIEK